MSFTTLSLRSVGLGYSKPALGPMERPPLLPRPAAPDPRAYRLARHRGAADGGRHPERDRPADRAGGLAEARTMGMVTLALFFLFFSIEVPQWLICTAVALSIVVAAGIRKAVLRRAAARP